MANEKISQLPTVTNAALGATSIFPVVDSTDSETKSISIGELDSRYAASDEVITALTGDVAATGNGGSAAATIQPNTVTNTKLAQMAANTLKGNNTGSSANAADLSVAQVLALLGIIAPTAPQVTVLTSGTGSYITPVGCLYFKVKMAGGGGGGCGSGIGNNGSGGGAGGATTFGTTLLVANGGGGSADYDAPGAGGSASLGTGPIGVAISGGYGSTGSYNGSVSTSQTPGGTGGVSPLGGAGGGRTGNLSGLAAIDNSGSGGGGASVAGNDGRSGGGGGAGGWVDAVITSPAASYSYAIGAGGTGGTAGPSGYAGGPGGSGVIIITAYFQ